MTEFKNFQITIIVPIKDNPRRTRHFLKNNIYSEFQYIFADGSYDKANEKIFAGLTKTNINYIRFPPDDSRVIYYRKMQSAAKSVTTPFVMTMDAGDFLLPEGVERCVNTLKENGNASAAGSDIFFTVELFGFMSDPLIVNHTSKISRVSQAEALRVMQDEYYYLWYSVHHAHDCVRIWDYIVAENLQHPFMEYLPTLALLSTGVYIDTKITHLLRVADSPRRKTKRPQDMNRDPKLDVTREVSKFSESVARNFGINQDLIVAAISQNSLQVSNSLNPITKIKKSVGIFGVILFRLTFSMSSHSAYWIIYYWSFLRPPHRNSSNLLITSMRHKSFVLSKLRRASL